MRIMFRNAFTQQYTIPASLSVKQPAYSSCKLPTLSASVAGTINLTDPNSSILVKPKLSGTNVQPESVGSYQFTVQQSYSYKNGKKTYTSWRNVTDHFEIVPGSFDSKSGSFRIRRAAVDKNLYINPGNYRILLTCNGSYRLSKYPVFKVKQSAVSVKASEKQVMLSRYDRNASVRFDLWTVKPEGAAIMGIEPAGDSPFMFRYNEATGKVRVCYTAEGYDEVQKALAKKPKGIVYSVKLRVISSGEYDTGKALSTITIRVQVK